ncbi:MAG: RNA polymerase sigma factor RpoD/SigA [Spirochaetaceae bacterium]|jgi:RNA polymerase primary sigma factor|nr:RNA polymerase sigma factor RpoD/SigA [Spirochaetaceae bacterium]
MSKVSFEMQTDSAYKAYIEQVKKIPLLSPEEEQGLTGRAAEGNQSAIKRLIEANLRLVIKIGQKYVSNDISLMDIIQEGNVGLMHAVEKFDLSKNVRFATYAVLWIKQSIARFVVSKRRAIRLPFKKEELLRKIYIAEHILHQKLGRAPKVEEIASETGYSLCDVELVMNISSNPLSLEAEFSENENCSFAEICEDSRQCNPEREFIMHSSRNETRRFLKRYLNFRERNVILHRFRFVESDVYTFKKLGDVMGISAEAVRQIEKRALNKIRTKSDELLSCVYA